MRQKAAIEAEIAVFHSLTERIEEVEVLLSLATDENDM